MSLGERIAAKRAELGMSQRMLAKKSGVSQPTISAIESSTKAPSTITIQAIAEALGTSLSELIDEEKKVQNPATQSKIDQIAGLLETADDRFVDDVVAYIKFRKSVQSESE